MTLPLSQRAPDSRVSRLPLVAPGHTAGSVTDQISAVVLAKTPRWWIPAFAVAFALLNLFLIAIGWLFVKGIGIWGINMPVAWGWDIVNFVWWVGIGHAGTLISAILLLLRQQWRTSINRFAEAMTIFAVACAAQYPILHLGRPWLFFWLLPYPSSRAMGWRGSAAHWHNYEAAYLLLAGLATPLVLSVHSVVSFDFAVAVVPGWHTTIFPPYFVAGAVFSGFAMVMTLSIPLRKLFRLEDFITLRHIANMAKVMLVTGLIVAYGYVIEIFMAFYSNNQHDIAMIKNRIFGPYWFQYAMLWACNIVIPQLMWFRRVRRNVVLLFVISIIVNVGMWLERFVIIVTSLHRDFLPSSWGMYHGTFWDISTYIGTLGLFLSLMFLFIRFLPSISIFEMRTILPDAKVEEKP